MCLSLHIFIYIYIYLLILMHVLEHAHVFIHIAFPGALVLSFLSELITHGGYTLPREASISICGYLYTGGHTREYSCIFVIICVYHEIFMVICVYLYICIYIHIYIYIYSYVYLCTNTKSYC